MSLATYYFSIIFSVIIGIITIDSVLLRCID